VQAHQSDRITTAHVMWACVCIDKGTLVVSRYGYMGRIGNVKWNGDDGSYARIVEKERQRKKKKQVTCTHPDAMVVCLCRAYLDDSDRKGYVARRKDDLVVK
jgi:hypothetical protein